MPGYAKMYNRDEETIIQAKLDVVLVVQQPFSRVVPNLSFGVIPWPT